MQLDEAKSRHDELYKAASALIMPLIELHGRPPRPLVELEKGQLRRGIELYQAALQIYPENWAAMWLAGKCHQRLLEHEAAFEWFTRAHELNPVQPDVAREAALSAMYLGRAEEAILFCTSAIDAKPADPGLRANLALALLLSGEVEKAQNACEDALRRDPKDAITARLASVCKSVRAGERPCPRRLSDVDDTVAPVARWKHASHLLFERVIRIFRRR